LEIIARDFQDASIVAVDFLSAEGKTAFVATDTMGNIRMLEWDPERKFRYRARLKRKDTWTADSSQQFEILEAGTVEGGDRLFRRTEYHCGGMTTKTVTVARRRPNEDKSVTQTQIALGEPGVLWLCSKSYR
jgi:hypothetical protein